MTANLFVAIDFDGTITEKDITDAVIQKFAKPGWEAAEEEWEKGLIGSRECLRRQMELIDAPMDEILRFVDGFTVEKSFPRFAGFLKEHNIAHAVVSDGFREFSQRILKNSGLGHIPVFANSIKKDGARTTTLFPHSVDFCSAGTCKCRVSEKEGDGAPVILIGDGRSDFCLAEKALLVFSKKKLTKYCAEKGILHIPYRDFKDIQDYFGNFVSLNSAGKSPAKRQLELERAGI